MSGVRSLLCVRQFYVEQSSDDTTAGTPDTCFMRNLIRSAASGNVWGIVIMDSVACMHARTDEDIYVKTETGHQVESVWEAESCNDRTRRAIQQW